MSAAKGRARRTRSRIGTSARFSPRPVAVRVVEEVIVKAQGSVPLLRVLAGARRHRHIRRAVVVHGAAVKWLSLALLVFAIPHTI